MGHLQIVDATEAAVVKDKDVYLLLFLHDGHNLRMKHLEGAVSHHCINFLLRLCHLYSKGCSYFVAHAGVSVLCVISVAGICCPKPLHTAGKGASCCDYDTVCRHLSPKSGNCCGLGKIAFSLFHKLRNGSWVSFRYQWLEALFLVGIFSQTIIFLIPFRLTAFDFTLVSGTIILFS